MARRRDEALLGQSEPVGDEGRRARFDELEIQTLVVGPNATTVNPAEAIVKPAAAVEAALATAPAILLLSRSRGTEMVM